MDNGSAATAAPDLSVPDPDTVGPRTGAVGQRRAPMPQRSVPVDPTPLLVGLGAIAASVVVGHAAMLGASRPFGEVVTQAWATVGSSVLLVPLVRDSGLVGTDLWAVAGTTGQVLTVWAGILVVFALLAAAMRRESVLGGTATMVALAFVTVGAGLRLAHVVADLDLHTTFVRTSMHLVATPILPVVAIAAMRHALRFRRRPLPPVPLG